MKLIGVYRKCDFVTLAGGASAVLGIILSIHGHPYFAILCLILAAICDGFDGVVARKHKSEKYEQVYGTELDTICDVISFGILPMVIIQGLTDWNIWITLASILFCIFGIIRLAYFDMLAITKKSDGKSYVGVPIIISAFLLPPTFFALEIFKWNVGNIVYPIFLVIWGFLCVIPVRLRKPTLKEKIGLVIFALVFIAIISYFYFNR